MPPLTISCLPDELQRVVWSWYILPLRARLFTYMLCATSRKSTDGLETLYDARALLGGMTYLQMPYEVHGNVTPYRGEYNGYERGTYNFNTQTAVVLMGIHHPRMAGIDQTVWHFAEYSAEQDDDVWSFRLDYARVAGRTDRIELKYNESWESKVE